MQDNDPFLQLDETMLIASMCKSRDVYVATQDLKMQPWFFRDLKNRLLYEEMTSLIAQRTHQEFKAVLIGKKTAGMVRLKQISDVDAEFYIEMFKDDDYVFLNFVDIYLNESREILFSSITNRIKEAMKKGEDYHSLMSELTSLDPSDNKIDIMSFDEIADSMDDEIGKPTYTTGIEGLDEIMKIEDATLLIWGGESSSGKTSITNQVLFNLYETTKHNSLYFSLETTQVKLGNRFQKMIAKMKDMAFYEAKNFFREKIKSRIKITKLVNDIETIEKVIRDQVRKDDMLKFIAIDYLQIIGVKAPGYIDETPRVSHVTKILHNLAQELGLVIILLCQLTKEDYSKSKGVVTRSAPTMSSLRGSGQIANSADYIVINWFKDVHPNKTAESREVTLQVVKNKEGIQAGVTCDFIGKDLTFMERF